MPYPYEVPVTFSFTVKILEFSSEGECSFSDISGLTVKIDLEKINEGGVNDYVHKLPQKSQYNELVLKRGMLKGSALIAWVNDAVRMFTFTPKSIDISLLNKEGNPTITWNVVNAYPVGIEISEFKAQDNSIAVETLTLAYRYFNRNDIT